MINNKTFFILAAIISILAVTGCNTMEGLGEDIEKGGEAIQREAK